MIRLGPSLVSRFYLGTEKAQRVYHGPDLLWIDGLTVPTNCYFSAAGNDYTGDGSIGNPWKTIQMANYVALAGNRNLFFRGGDTFGGSLKAQVGCVYNSYGTGKALIQSGLAMGFYNNSLAGVKVRNLRFQGAQGNTRYGVYFVNALWYNVRLTGCEASGCEVFGYGHDGINFTAINSPYGFQSPLIQNNEIYDCDKTDLKGHSGGIMVMAPDWWGLAVNPPSHMDVQVLNNYVHDNKGHAGAANHVGNGIIIAQTQGGLMQGNVCTDNGENSTAHSGPVGCWSWDSDGVIIRKNTVLRQKTNGPDGSGFDLDGGCTNCVLEYNYSRDCKGPGILMFSFNDLKDGPNVVMNNYANNTARYNFSYNDGNNNEYSRYSFFIGTTKPLSTDFKNIRAYHNTVVSNDIGENAPDCCVVNTFDRVEMNHAQGLVANNLFIQRSRGLLTDIRRNQIDMQGNCYYTMQGTAMRYYGFDWWDPKVWSASTGDDGPLYGPKEFRYNSYQFYYGNPRVADEAGDDPDDYLPIAGSPIIGIGQNLNLEYGIALATEDYSGRPIDGTQLFWTPGCMQPAAPTNLIQSPKDVSAAPWQNRYDPVTFNTVAGRLGAVTAKKITPNTGSTYCEVYQPRSYGGARTVRRGMVIKGDDIDAGMLMAYSTSLAEWMNAFFNMRTPQYEKSEPQGDDYVMNNVRMQKRENGFWLVYYDLTFATNDTFSIVPTNLTGPWGVTGNGSRGLIVDEVFEFVINP